MHLGHELAGAACDICSNNPHAIFCSSRDIARPALSDDVAAVSGEWQAVVRGDEDHGDALGRQARHRPAEGRVVADGDAKR